MLLQSCLLKKGAKVVLFDLKEDVKEIAKEIDSTKAMGVSCDVTDNESMDHAVSEVLSHYKKIDILVNCAGIALLDDAENISEEYWQKNNRY